MNQKVLTVSALLLNISLVLIVVNLHPFGVSELSRFDFFAENVRDTILYDILKAIMGRKNAVYGWYCATLVLMVFAWRTRHRTGNLIQKVVSKV